MIVFFIGDFDTNTTHKDEEILSSAIVRFECRKSLIIV